MIVNNKCQATSNINLPEKLSSVSKCVRVCTVGCNVVFEAKLSKLIQVLSYCRVSNSETCAALVEMGSVKVNDEIITSPSFKVNIVEDEILVRSEVVTLPPVIDNSESIVDR